MTEELWSDLKAHLLAEGGHDALIEFLMFALAAAEIERDKREEMREARLQ